MSTTAIPPVEIGMLEMMLLGVGSILFVVAQVCFVLVVVKMFQHKDSAVGVLTIVAYFLMGIGQFTALIFGWMKVVDWNSKRLMIVYTLTLMFGLICLGAGYGTFMVRQLLAE